MTHSRPWTRPMPVTTPPAANPPAHVAPPVAGPPPGAGDPPAVHAVCGELRELEERAAGVEQHADTLARGELAGGLVLVGRGLRAAARRPARLAPQILDQCARGALVVLELLGVHIDPSADVGHGVLATVAGLSDNHTIRYKEKASP